MGETGELYTGGDGVACGYLNRPELTTKRFVPDPFSSEPGARLYRTGDNVRRRPDGNIEFLGRIDTQVKIRGFRVELGEIESALRACPGVREAVVIWHEKLPANGTLAAYVVFASDTRLSTAEMRGYIRERLPEYMTPSVFITRDHFPLMPNGKLDRRNLPAPENDTDAPPNNPQQPKDLLEQELIRIWQRLFHRQTIDRQDHFSDLGGHSLLAAQLAAEIVKLTGVKLPIAALLQSPTIASLALRLTEEKWLPLWSSLVPLQPQGSKPPLFFVHGWGGDVYAFMDLAKLY
jgi:acyl carrier protein